MYCKRLCVDRHASVCTYLCEQVRVCLVLVLQFESRQTPQDSVAKAAG